MESLIPVDISPINTREVSDIQSVIDALRSVDLNINGPISKVRKLADEQLKHFIQVPISYIKIQNSKFILLLL